MHDDNYSYDAFLILKEIGKASKSVDFRDSLDPFGNSHSQGTSNIG
jgi:hypothetical protein